MHWEIAEEAPERSAAPGEGSNWQTRLRLRLPRLGDVRATLKVGAGGVSIGLTVDTGSAADAMKAASASLRSAFIAAGLRPAGFRIERHAVGRG
jgi:flagellar hook-length control protein FliK